MDRFIVADAGSGSIAFPYLKSNMDRFIDSNTSRYETTQYI